MTPWDDIEIDDTPRAEVQRIGRWTYRVSIKQGLIDGYDWHVFGRRRAARKAVKVLRRYLRDQMRQSETVTIEGDM
jgi:hypothetical protein